MNRNSKRKAEKRTAAEQAKMDARKAEMSPYECPVRELVKFLNFGPTEVLLKAVEQFTKGQLPADVTMLEPVEKAMNNLAFSMWTFEKSTLWLVVLRKADLLGIEGTIQQDFQDAIVGDPGLVRQLCARFLERYEPLTNHYAQMLSEMPTDLPPIAEEQASRTPTPRCWLPVGKGWYVCPYFIEQFTVSFFESLVPDYEDEDYRILDAVQFGFLPMMEQSVGRPTGLGGNEGLVAFLPRCKTPLAKIKRV